MGREQNFRLEHVPGGLGRTERLRRRRILRCLLVSLLPPALVYLVRSPFLIECAHLQNQQRRVLPRQLEDDLVHLLTWRSPRRPEIDERHSVEVDGEELLEVLRGFDFDKICGGGEHGWVVRVSCKQRYIAKDGEYFVIG